jgi:hypothetical protein
MRYRQLLLVTLAAVCCFGGSFTCRSKSHDNANNPPAQQP